MTTRLFIAALALLGIYGGARWARDRGMPSEPAPLEMKAQDLPMTLGEWKGENVTLDQEMFKAIGAEMVLDRMYRNRSGRAASLHFAVFAKPDKAQGLPHTPDVCYPASGWRLGDPQYVPLDQAAATGNLAKFEPVERRGETGYLLFWYQIDGVAYCTGDRQRAILLACRGRPVRPPVVKVMLHTSAASPEEAQKTLQSLAGEVYAWTRGFR